MVLVNGALLDPAADEVALGGLERGLVRIGRRHDLVGIGADDAEPRFGVGDVAGHESAEAVAINGGGVELVEAELGFAVGGITAVAGEAVVREDGADVLVVGDGLGGAGDCDERARVEKRKTEKRGSHGGGARGANEARSEKKRAAQV